jgi:NAD(P)-dependent dehydrogenase (short-subunit alcohol dehydrogenase family)
MMYPTQVSPDLTEISSLNETRLEMASQRTIFILSASSDIGRYLMDRYLAEGCVVIGTHRRQGALDAYIGHPRAHTLRLDLDDQGCLDQIQDFSREKNVSWDLFIAANATMEPIGPFMKLDSAQWQQSITTNALMPCRLVKALYPFRQPNRVNSVIFFAGGGTNNPFRNYSAYCLSKILLIKMCELLDDEVPDLKTFILGPGYVRTKIHDETLAAGEWAGENREKTQKFLSGEGTSMDDIYDCLEWCIAQNRGVVGGRNFSVVHDPWRNGGAALVAALTIDQNLYKLRRAGNT